MEISFDIFHLKCEARIKKLRNEDNIMREIKRQRRAHRNWEKVVNCLTTINPEHVSDS